MIYVKTKICKQCQKPFQLFITISGKKHCLYTRSYCLECWPKGSHFINDNKKKCPSCLETKDISEFVQRKGKFVYSWCRNCSSQKNIERQQINKQKAVAYKGGKCCICGYSKSLRSLNFHHTDPIQKEFSIAKHKCLNWADTQQELDKCVLVCANCHGEIHDNITPIPKSVLAKHLSPQLRPTSSDIHQTKDA